MPTVPAVFYSRGLPRSLVVEAPEGLMLVPMVPAIGWAQRTAYKGHRAAPKAVEHHEAEIQLRSTGWTDTALPSGPARDDT